VNVATSHIDTPTVFKGQIYKVILSVKYQAPLLNDVTNTAGASEEHHSLFKN
jgi:hypothetical protein